MIAEPEGRMIAKPGGSPMTAHAGGSHDSRTGGSPVTYVVTENCIACKHTDCVEVCPVDCFYEGENVLVIHPDECIDCGVCEPECPVDAIRPDTRAGDGAVGRVQPQMVRGLARDRHEEGTPCLAPRRWTGARARWSSSRRPPARAAEPEDVTSREARRASGRRPAVLWAGFRGVHGGACAAGPAASGPPGAPRRMTGPIA